MKLPKKKDFKKEVSRYIIPMFEKERKRKRKKLREDTLSYINREEKNFLIEMYQMKTRIVWFRYVDYFVIGIKYLAIKYGFETKVTFDEYYQKYHLIISIP